MSSRQQEESILGRTLAGWRELPESFQGWTGEMLRGGESLTTPKEKGVGERTGYEGSKCWVGLDLMQRDGKMWFTTANTFV